MPIVQILRQATEALEAASVPEGWRPRAFPEVVRLIAASVTPVSGEGPVLRPPHAGPAGDAADALAQRVGVPAQVLSELYVLEGSDLQLAIPSRKIASTKKDGTGEIAVLVAAGRQGLGVDEDWTPVTEIRRWAQELGRYDEKHFKAHLESVDHLLTFVGKSGDRKVRVKWHERDQLRELLSRVAERD